jgi:TM2 domain-containing membrane protein YozV
MPEQVTGDRRTNMNKAIKAALLSALVFPGSGQLYLKRYWRGLMMMTLVVLALAVMIVRATVVALDSLRIMQVDGKATDVNVISHLAETSSASIFTDNTAVLVFLVLCWVFSVVDAYRIAKRDLSATGNPQ